jgi:hypothetical protein
MIRQPLEELSPISSLPEAEAFHLDIVITHGRVAVWCALQVKINQLLQVRADDLVRVDEDDFLQVHREQHIEEQDLIRPDNSLLLFLSTQPRWPLVSNKFVLEAILLGEMWDEFLITGHTPVRGITANNEHSQGTTGTKSSR